jgi:hypothetical protein
MFPDEEACLAYLPACRWPDGFRCPRCGHDQAFALPRRRLWQCKAWLLGTHRGMGADQLPV